MSKEGISPEGEIANEQNDGNTSNGENDLQVTHEEDHAQSHAAHVISPETNHDDTSHSDQYTKGTDVQTAADPQNTSKIIVSSDTSNNSNTANPSETIGIATQAIEQKQLSPAQQESVALIEMSINNYFQRITQTLDRYILHIEQYFYQTFTGDVDHQKIMRELYEKLLNIRFGKKTANNSRDDLGIANEELGIEKRMQLVEETILAFDFATIRRTGLNASENDAHLLLDTNEINKNAPYPTNAEIAELLMLILSDKNKRKYVYDMKKSKNSKARQTYQAIEKLFNKINLSALLKPTRTPALDSEKEKPENPTLNPGPDIRKVSERKRLTSAKNIHTKWMELLAEMGKKEEWLNNNSIEKYNDNDPHFFESLLHIDRSLFAENVQDKIVKLLLVFNPDISPLKQHSLGTNLLLFFDNRISEKELLLKFIKEDRWQLFHFLRFLSNDFNRLQIISKISHASFLELIEWERNRELSSLKYCVSSLRTTFSQHFNQIGKSLQPQPVKLSCKTVTTEALEKFAEREKNANTKELFAIFKENLILLNDNDRQADRQACYDYAAKLFPKVLSNIELILSLTKDENLIQQFSQSLIEIGLPPKRKLSDSTLSIAATGKLINSFETIFQIPTKTKMVRFSGLTPAELEFHKGSKKYFDFAKKLANHYVQHLNNYLQRASASKPSYQIAKTLQNKLQNIIRDINNSKRDINTRRLAVGDILTAFQEASVARYDLEKKSSIVRRFFSRVLEFFGLEGPTLKGLLIHFKRENRERTNFCVNKLENLMFPLQHEWKMSAPEALDNSDTLYNREILHQSIKSNAAALKALAAQEAKAKQILLEFPQKMAFLKASQKKLNFQQSQFQQAFPDQQLDIANDNVTVTVNRNSMFNRNPIAKATVSQQTVIKRRRHSV